MFLRVDLQVKVFLSVLLIFAQSFISSAVAATSQGMVVTSQSLASQAGLQILNQGGNAIDAAVAVGYALAVTEPCCGNIGGGGFMLIHLANGQNHFINFREKAPQAIYPQLFLDSQGNIKQNVMTHNYLSVGVPGTVMGLNTALKEYGRLSLKQVIQPAINLAKNGFLVSPYLAESIKTNLNSALNQTNVANIFFKEGKPLQAGDRLMQTELGNTLQQIASGGSKAFYQGNSAKQIVAASEQDHGVFTQNDFNNYMIDQQTPIYCQYHGYQIISAPPPSSGGVTLCEMLQIIQHYPLKVWGYQSAKSAHINIEAMRYAYADRNQYLGDPDFVRNPIQRLLSQNHIQNIIKQIDKNIITDSQKLGVMTSRTSEQPQTTHYSVIDKYGNAVAVTYTLNGEYGAKVIAGNTGFFLNNELDDFAIQIGKANQYGLVQGNANLIAPNKRPLSTMTPTIVTKNGKIVLIVGSPGGSTIATTVLQIIEDVIDYGMTINQAVAAPRYHMQWLPDNVFIEQNVFSPKVLSQLQQMGYVFIVGSPFNTAQWGAVAAIERDPSTGKLIGAIDPRRPDGLVAE